MSKPRRKNNQQGNYDCGQHLLESEANFQVKLSQVSLTLNEGRGKTKIPYHCQQRDKERSNGVQAELGGAKYTGQDNAAAEGEYLQQHLPPHEELDAFFRAGVNITHSFLEPPQSADKRECAEGGQDGSQGLRVAAGRDVEDVAGAQGRVGGVAFAFEEVVGVDDLNNRFAAFAPADDVDVLFVSFGSDAAGEGERDGQGKGLAVGDGQDAFGSDFAEGKHLGGVGGDEQDVAGHEADAARRGAQVGGQERAQVVGGNQPGVHDLGLGERGFYGRAAREINQGQERHAAACGGVVGAGLADFADDLDLGDGGIAGGQKQDVAGGQRQVLGGVGPGQQLAEVNGRAGAPPVADKGGGSQRGRDGGAAGQSDEVEQVHPGPAVVEAGAFGGSAENADFAGAALLQGDGDLRLVKLGAETSGEGLREAVDGLARRMDFADDGVVERAVGQDGDAGFELVVALHGDVKLIVGRQDVRRVGRRCGHGSGGGHWGRLGVSGGEDGEEQEAP